jgi:fumarate reductase (CoM/CoB) subunit B
MRNEKKVIARVYRYDPSTDVTSRYEVYEVPWREKMTILEVLRYIYENYEPVAFRYSCRCMYCGTCAVQIDGRPGLACETFAEPGDVTIEPLKGFPVIRDLVIDRSNIADTALSTRSYLQRSIPPKEELEKIPPKEVEPFYELARCKDCLICQSACPVVEVGETRFSGPTIMTLYHGTRAYDPRDESDRVNMMNTDGLWYCVNCLRCQELCPSEIDIPKIIFKEMREKAVSKGLSVPSPFRQFGRSISKTGRVESLGKKLDTEATQLLDMVPEVIAPGKAVARVGFFIGCQFNDTLKEAAMAALDILKYNNIETVIPKEQVCCGMPLFWTGQSGLAGELVQKNVEAFERFDVKTVLTMCAGCGMTWKDDIPKSFKKAFGRSPNFEVRDIHEFLAERGIAVDGIGAIKQKVTYHDPCHLRRGQGISEEPRLLIRSIPGVELVEMETPDSCCGSFLAHLDPVKAMKLATMKIDQAKETEARIVATACPFCTRMLTLAAKHAREKNIEVLNVVELIHRAYGIHP